MLTDLKISKDMGVLSQDIACVQTSPRPNFRGSVRNLCAHRAPLTLLQMKVLNFHKMGSEKTSFKLQAEED